MPAIKKKTTAQNPLPALPVAPVVGLTGWYADESKAIHLRALLDDPVLLEALAILLERSRFTQSVVNSDPATHSAKLGWQAGYQEAITDLRTVLTDPSAPAKHRERAENMANMLEAQNGEDWDYINRGTGLFANIPDDIE